MCMRHAACGMRHAKHVHVPLQAELASSLAKLKIVDPTHATDGTDVKINFEQVLRV